MPSAWNRPNNPMSSKRAGGSVKPSGLSGIMPSAPKSAALKVGTPGLGAARFNLRTARGKKGS